MIFRQLFDPDTSSFSYLFGCERAGTAALVDPVRETADRDLASIAGLGLRLTHCFETHIHADHISGSWHLRELTGCRIACPALEHLPCADIAVSEESAIGVGSITFHPLFTPGHTDSHHCYLVDDGHGTTRVCTGDSLLIDGCGRTDFQSGDAAALFRSVREKLFSLPDDTLVFPAHDYHGRRVSTIAQERARNPRLGGARSLVEFVALMASLDLPYPRMIDVAVPANRACGTAIQG